MKKMDEIALENSCLNKADDEEPIFVLRAQDKFAPVLVGLWAILATLVLGEEHPKVIEAQSLARQMSQWPHRKYPD